ncbi:cyclic nucleotide-binding domain-containing protein [Synechococcus sp. CS-1332]|uniref:cyclic nucleotide-binding domain-containing protein n=1 Tax=Synechococcus sp. CS-1332 TaxID=2847972 RepID=UPI00223C0904|nr:cyclic nucleotide-binding domain-containing protein [Synechococcus sp. CS-1332]MCT0206591.1 cyclic nucleotide-binding domain-containing protein [Synechococcus sp. CS-1332]
MTSPTPGALTTMRLLAQDRGLRTLAAGEVIFRAGDMGASVFGIVDGEVRIDWAEARNSEILGPGSSFGVGALLDYQHRRVGTATALRDTQLLEMDREQFLFALQELPMFALEMLHNLERRLGHLPPTAGDTLSQPPQA